jgi:hypothetical protein
VTLLSCPRQAGTQGRTEPASGGRDQARAGRASAGGGGLVRAVAYDHDVEPCARDLARQAAHHVGDARVLAAGADDGEDARPGRGGTALEHRL